MQCIPRLRFGLLSLPPILILKVDEALEHELQLCFRPRLGEPGSFHPSPNRRGVSVDARPDNPPPTQHYEP